MKTWTKRQISAQIGICSYSHVPKHKPWQFGFYRPEIFVGLVGKGTKLRIAASGLYAVNWVATLRYIDRTRQYTHLHSRIVCKRITRFFRFAFRVCLFVHLQQPLDIVVHVHLRGCEVGMAE